MLAQAVCMTSPCIFSKIGYDRNQNKRTTLCTVANMVSSIPIRNHFPAIEEIFNNTYLQLLDNNSYDRQPVALFFHRRLGMSQQPKSRNVKAEDLCQAVEALKKIRFVVTFSLEAYQVLLIRIPFLLYIFIEFEILNFSTIVVEKIFLRTYSGE